MTDISLRRLKFYPRTLRQQLIAVTILAVLISNMLALVLFGIRHEHDSDAALVDRLLDRAVSTAILLSKLSPDTQMTALRAFTNNIWGSYGFHHGTLKAVPMSKVEGDLAKRVHRMLPPDLAKYKIAVHFTPTFRFVPLPPPGRMHGNPPVPPPQDLMPPEHGDGLPPHGGNGMHPPHMGPENGPPGRGEGPPPGQLVPIYQQGGGEVVDHPPMADRMLEIVIPLSDDLQMVATFFRPPSFFWSNPVLLATLFTILIASLAATFVARRVTRPLAKLAEAANQAAMGQDAPPVPEVGPDDIRKAAMAFNAMNGQVKRTLESQRHLLSAVGHDLRTPITAMRINIEFVEDEELAKRLAANLDELHALTEAVLSAARGVSGEKSRQVDLSALVESVTADLDDLGRPVQWLGGDPAPLFCRPNEIRRAVRNLIENAVNYGKRADVSVHMNPDAYEVWVEDIGPGIPPDDRERVFEPFVRLEGSRNLATGGVGLGMTLAKTVAEGHGGKIQLEDRDGGGMRVRVVLPRRLRDGGTA